MTKSYCESACGYTKQLYNVHVGIKQLINFSTSTNSCLCLLLHTDANLLSCLSFFVHFFVLVSDFSSMICVFLSPLFLASRLQVHFEAL